MKKNLQVADNYTLIPIYAESVGTPDGGGAVVGSVVSFQLTGNSLNLATPTANFSVNLSTLDLGASAITNVQLIANTLRITTTVGQFNADLSSLNTGETITSMGLIGRSLNIVTSKQALSVDLNSIVAGFNSVTGASLAGNTLNIQTSTGIFPVDLSVLSVPSLPTDQNLTSNSSTGIPSVFAVKSAVSGLQSQLDALDTTLDTTSDLVYDLQTQFDGLLIPNVSGLQSQIDALSAKDVTIVNTTSIIRTDLTSLQTTVSQLTTSTGLTDTGLQSQITSLQNATVDLSGKADVVGGKVPASQLPIEQNLSSASNSAVPSVGAVKQRFDELLNGASSAFDTLKELSDAIADNAQIGSQVSAQLPTLDQKNAFPIGANTLNKLVTSSEINQIKVNLVDLSTNQSIAGIKTFSEKVRSNGISPNGNGFVASNDYVFGSSTVEFVNNSTIGFEVGLGNAFHFLYPNEAFLIQKNAQKLHIGTNNVPRLTIHGSGDVGIGTTSPTSKLQVSGVIHSSTGGFKFPDGTSQITAALNNTIEQNLTSNSTVSIPSIKAVKDAINETSSVTVYNAIADSITSDFVRTYHDNAQYALDAAGEGGTANINSLKFISTNNELGQVNGLAFPGVSLIANLYGLALTTPDANTDVFRFNYSSRIIVNGYNTTITTSPILASSGGIGWTLYAGPTSATNSDITINDIDIIIQGLNTSGFVIRRSGIVKFKGNIEFKLVTLPVTSSSVYQGRCAVLLNGSNCFFYGTGSIIYKCIDPALGISNNPNYRQYIFSIWNNTKLSWTGNITAYGDSQIDMNGTSTLELNNGVLNAKERIAGVELFTNTVGTVILNNYSVIVNVEENAIRAATVILRGNSVVVGNIVSPNIIDERNIVDTVIIADSLVSDSETQVPSVKAVKTAIDAVPKPTIEQNLTSNSTTNVPSVAAVRAVSDIIDLKVDKVSGKQLSDENFTLIEKNKLSTGILPIWYAINGSSQKYGSTLNSLPNGSENYIVYGNSLLSSNYNYGQTNANFNNSSLNLSGYQLTVHCGSNISNGYLSNGTISVVPFFAKTVIINGGNISNISFTNANLGYTPQLIVTVVLRGVSILRNASPAPITGTDVIVNWYGTIDMPTFQLDPTYHNVGTGQFNIFPYVAPAAGVTIEQNLSSNSTTGVPSIAAVNTAITSLSPNIQQNLTSNSTTAIPSVAAVKQELMKNICASTSLGVKKFGSSLTDIGSVDNGGTIEFTGNVSSLTSPNDYVSLSGGIRVIGNGFKLGIYSYAQVFILQNTVFENVYLNGGGTLQCSGAGDYTFKNGTLDNIKFNKNNGISVTINLYGTRIIASPYFAFLSNGVIVNWYGTSDYPNPVLPPNVNISGGTLNIYNWVSPANVDATAVHLTGNETIAGIKSFTSNMGIGTTSPNSKLEVAGVIHSTTGGIKFPDGSLQLSASNSSSNKGILRGFFAANTPYNAYDMIVNENNLYYAKQNFTSTTTFVQSNWQNSYTASPPVIAVGLQAYAAGSNPQSGSYDTLPLALSGSPNTTLLLLRDYYNTQNHNIGASSIYGFGANIEGLGVGPLLQINGGNGSQKLVDITFTTGINITGNGATFVNCRFNGKIVLNGFSITLDNCQKPDTTNYYLALRGTGTVYLKNTPYGFNSIDSGVSIINSSISKVNGLTPDVTGNVVITTGGGVDVTAVHQTGNETIGGQKTFSELVSVTSIVATGNIESQTYSIAGRPLFAMSGNDLVIGDGNTQLHDFRSNYFRWYTPGTAKGMNLDNSGNLKIDNNLYFTSGPSTTYYNQTGISATNTNINVYAENDRINIHSRDSDVSIGNGQIGSYIPRLTVKNAGNIGIGTVTPNSKLEVAGIIHTTSGGIKFPDGTTQTTAATGSGGGEQNIQSGSYILVASDASKVVAFTAAATCTIPVDTFPIGTIIEVAQDGTGQVTIDTVGGVTLRYGSDNGLKVNGQWSSVGLRLRATNEWVITNGIS